MTLARGPSVRHAAPRAPGVVDALFTNLRVIGAIMMRDGVMRYGHEDLGFFWVMGEPLVLTLGIMVMWTVTGSTHGHGVGVIPFALSGYTVLTLWRHMTARSVRVIRQNAGLLFHHNVKVLDVLMARAVIETVGILTAFFIAYIPLSLMGFIPPVRDSFILLTGYFLQAWFSFAVSLIIAGLSEMTEVLEQFVPPFLYLTLPFSGIFYMASWLPQEYRHVVLWSPLVNTMEMFRCGLFPLSVETNFSVPYTVVWCIVLTAIGIPIVEVAQRRVTLQ